MEIAWINHSCFALKGETITVLTDPFSSEIGDSSQFPEADIMITSNDHPNHCNTDAVPGDGYVVSTPGEYDIDGTYIRSIATVLKNESGAPKRNLITIIEIDKITIAHLGDLGEIPPSRHLEELNHVDVLLVPAGGDGTISPQDAARIVNLTEPKIVIPMHYKTETTRISLETADKFFEELGYQQELPQVRLQITDTNLPAERKIVILSPVG
jgi:L-ascorbate metabolism protein UlaG (beta-lactamase superfamily)